MRLTCENFSADDLSQRGLTPGDAPLIILLLDIEADFSIWEGDRKVYSESLFPVAQVAYELMNWLQRPAAGRQEFVLDSLSADYGLVRIIGTADGWRVGSIFAPDVWTSPVAWEALESEIKRFVQSVREGVASLGIDPTFILEP